MFDPTASSEANEAEILAELLIPEARSRLEASFRNSDAADTKALGMLGIAAGAIAVLVAVHGSVNQLWWIPAAVIGVSGALFVAAIWPRRFSIGPDLEVFYELLGDGPPLTASRQMLAELLQAEKINRKPWKVRALWWGLAVLIVALVGCLPIALIRPA